MKNITKDNKGITLIALILTIILMLILASVTTYTGIDTYRNSKVNKFVTDMQLIQAKVDDLVATKMVDELQLLGEDILSIPNATSVVQKASSNGEIVANDVNTNLFRYFSKENLLDELDIENVNSEIIINFTNREVISLEGVEYRGSTYYTQYKLPGGQTIINENQNIRELDFIAELSVDGLNSKVTIKKVENSSITLITNGTLSYKEQNDTYWKTITNYTETNKSYDVAIAKSGNYIFKLQDNTNRDNQIQKELIIKLTNRPKTDFEIDPYNYAGDSDGWAYIQKDSVNYVWIPRFAYDINNTNNTKFIKGNSNIATDNTYINENWSVHEKFTMSNGIELTGTWVSVSADEVNKVGQNMLVLLNDNNRTTLIEI